MIWQVTTPHPDRSHKLAQEVGIHPLLAQLLLNRGIDTPSDASCFLNGKLRDLYDPDELPDMENAVERIYTAISGKEKIIIHGDYDVDGIAGTALLLLVLQKLGANCAYLLPNRFTDGYGLKHEGIATAMKHGARLLITVDCGIKSCAEIEYATNRGLDVIVTDHHIPGGSLPDCIAVVNPARADSQYPFTHLSGAGVAFKLAHALIKAGRAHGHRLAEDIDLRDYLDLVALGTIGDIMPLVSENRILVKYGLKTIRETKRPGLKKLAEKAGLRGDVNSGHVAFGLAPRINARGRLGDAEAAVELFLVTDPEKAERLAQQLDRDNRERQKQEKRIVEEAVSCIERNALAQQKVIVLESENWSSGIIGIVAAKILRMYHRPTILISVSDGMGKGSARSIQSFHILHALQECGDLLNAFGGHRYAAGLTITTDTIDEFKQRINAVADQWLSHEDLIPHLSVDAEADIELLSFELLTMLDTLAPFGQGNPHPSFIVKNLTVIEPPRIVGNRHLKLVVGNKNKRIDAIGFDMLNRLEMLKRVQHSTLIDVVYAPRINHYGDNPTVQMELKAVRISEG